MVRTVRNLNFQISGNPYPCVLSPFLLIHLGSHSLCSPFPFPTPPSLLPKHFTLPQPVPSAHHLHTFPLGLLHFSLPSLSPLTPGSICPSSLPYLVPHHFTASTSTFYITHPGNIGLKSDTIKLATMHSKGCAECQVYLFPF